MFVVHFHVRTTEPGGLDDLVRLFVWRFVESKSHGTFALLFGAGFAIQLRRATQAGRPFAMLYLRRLIVLALFGFAAHAFFGFNVLLGYATWAVPLLILRSWSTRALLLTAVLSMTSVSLYRLAAAELLVITSGPAAAAAADEAQRAEAAAVTTALRYAETQHHYTALVNARLRQMAWFYSQPFFTMPGVTLALFIAGLLMVRHGIFENPRAHLHVCIALAACGFVSWLTANWLLPDVNFFGLVRDQWLTFTYVGAAILALAHSPRLIVRLRLVANAGRMALTNYLLQIAALDFLFSGYGVGLHQIRPITGIAAAVTCFGAEVLLSTWWLRRFRFGPAEWVWRSLTYARLQPMRRVGGSVQAERVGESV